MSKVVIGFNNGSFETMEVPVGDVTVTSIVHTKDDGSVLTIFPSPIVPPVVDSVVVTVNGVAQTFQKALSQTVDAKVGDTVGVRAVA